MRRRHTILVQASTLHGLQHPGVTLPVQGRGGLCLCGALSTNVPSVGYAEHPIAVIARIKSVEILIMIYI